MTCEEWPVIWPCDPPAGSEERIENAKAMAREMLWSRTGRRLGQCTGTESYAAPSTGACAVPYLSDRGWRLGAPGAPRFLVLRQQPVASVSAVTVDGVAVDASGYRLAGSRLYRVGAQWPEQTSELQAPRIEVTYTWGISVAEGSRWHPMVGLAMGEVAFEIHQALCGQPCKLPSRAVSVTRQGVTVQLGDPKQYVDMGLLGLPFADQLILAANPGRLAGQARVYSPDLPRSAAVAAP